MFGLIMQKLKRAIMFKHLKKYHVVEGQTKTNGRQILAHYKYAQGKPNNQRVGFERQCFLSLDMLKQRVVDHFTVRDIVKRFVFSFDYTLDL